MTYQWDGNIFIRQSVFPPGIVSEVQDSPISLDFTVHPLSSTQNAVEAVEPTPPLHINPLLPSQIHQLV